MKVHQLRGEKGRNRIEPSEGRGNPTPLLKIRVMKGGEWDPEFVLNS